MIIITQQDFNTLNSVAADVGTNPEYLVELIAFESGFNPMAKNPISSAKGLIQFIDSTARDLGYIDSQDLINQHPTITDQLNIPVRKYLKKYSPYPDKQSLYMAVFYPAAQYWPPEKEFNTLVQSYNLGIKTPGDYINKITANRKTVKIESGEIIQEKKNTWPIALIIVSAMAAIYILKKRS